MGQHILNGLKFILAILIVPLVMATVGALQGEIARLDPRLVDGIHLGIIIYVLMKFFVYDLDPVYKFGQTLISTCFIFLKPLMNFAPYVIPVYTLLGIIVYAIVNVMGKAGRLGPLFFGVIAFTFAMHIILTAQDLYKKDSLPGKPNYFFAMGLIFIVDVFLMALLISLAGKGFSFLDFFKSLSNISADIYVRAFKQLFFP
jgi:hypothetical protein